MVEVIRVDFILSYWIFIWWILYMLGIVEYNPKLFLIIGLITNIIGLFIKMKNAYVNKYIFIIVVIITKIIPLYTLKNTEINFFQDLSIIIIICIIYLFWLYVNNKFSILYTLLTGDKNIIPPMEYVIGKMLNQ
jgi:hypothetical protein